METSFKKTGSQFVLVVEHTLPHAPEKVWRALTERDLLKKWFPCDIEGEWVEGVKLSFTFLQGEGEGLPEDIMKGEVLTVDPPRLLEFRWGPSLIRYELSADGAGSKLLLSETQDDPSMGARNGAGWEMCLDNLNLLLDGAVMAAFALDVWRKKHKKYSEKFEPEFGPQQDIPDSHPAVRNAE